MTFEEHLQIENFKAQYNKILEEISVVNQRLQKALGELDTAKGEYARIVALTQDALKTLDSLYESLADLEFKVGVKERQFKHTTENHEAYIVEAKRETAREAERLATIQEAIKEGRDMLNFITINLALIKEEEAQALEDRDLAVRELESVKRDKFEIEKKIHEVSEDFSEMFKGFSKAEREKEKELTAIESKIMDAKSKIKKPLELLEHREEIVARREQNLEILITRFRGHFKKLFPNQEVKV